MMPYLSCAHILGVPPRCGLSPQDALFLLSHRSSCCHPHAVCRLSSAPCLPHSGWRHQPNVGSQMKQRSVVYGHRFPCCSLGDCCFSALLPPPSVSFLARPHFVRLASWHSSITLPASSATC